MFISSRGIIEKHLNVPYLTYLTFNLFQANLKSIRYWSSSNKKTEYVDEKRHIVYCNDIDKVSPSLKVKVLFKSQFLIELP